MPEFRFPDRSFDRSSARAAAAARLPRTDSAGAAVALASAAIAATLLTVERA